MLNYIRYNNYHERKFLLMKLTRARRKMEEFERVCCIRGYHVYRHIWEAHVGENLVCERQPNNETDRYAVSVKQDGTIIGHMNHAAFFHSSLLLRLHG